MSAMKFDIGAPVFFYTMIDRVPGVVENAERNEKGNWVYEIKIGKTMIAKGVPEDHIEIRTLFDEPKYHHGDRVIFKASREEQYVGIVEIVDRYGTFEQAEEPSYDILVKGEPGCLYKHIRESDVIGPAE